MPQVDAGGQLRGTACKRTQGVAHAPPRQPLVGADAVAAAREQLLAQGRIQWRESRDVAVGHGIEQPRATHRALGRQRGFAALPAQSGFPAAVAAIAADAGCKVQFEAVDRRAHAAAFLEYMVDQAAVGQAQGRRRRPQFVALAGKAGAQFCMGVQAVARVVPPMAVGGGGG